MNSLQLGSRLTGKLTVKNLASLVAEDAVTLIDALNGGLKEWFDGLPPKDKQTRVSEIVRAPLVMTLSVVDGAKGFAYVSPPFPTGGYADETALLGKSVTLSAAGPVNRLDQAGTLLKPYLGTNGNVSATFWSDAIAYASTNVRIVDTPIWEGEGSGRWELVPATLDLFPTLDGWGAMGRAPESGAPRYYHAGSLNPTLNSVRRWFLRLWPLPNARGTVTFTLESTPPVLGLDALQVATDVPIPDEDIPDLIPLCEDRLTGTTLWSPLADKQKAFADAARTRDRLERKWIPLSAAPTHICTPSNW